MSRPPTDPADPRTGRRLLHTRRIALHGYRRADGRYEIEAELTDTKTRDLPMLVGAILPAGQPLHGMRLNMVIDAALRIEDFSATMRDTPYSGCRQAETAFGRLVGLTIQPGFLREAQRRVGGTAGCTHLRELLQQLATTAYQTVVADREDGPSRALAPGERPKLLDSCAGYRADGEAVRIRWPAFYRITAADGNRS